MSNKKKGKHQKNINLSKNAKKKKKETSNEKKGKHQKNINLSKIAKKEEERNIK